MKNLENALIALFLVALSGCSTGIGITGSPVWLATVEKDQARAYYHGLCSQLGLAEGSTQHTNCVAKKPSRNKLIESETERSKDALLRIGAKFDYECTVEAASLFPVQVVTTTTTKPSTTGRLVRQGTGDFTASCSNSILSGVTCSGRERTTIAYVPDAPTITTSSRDVNEAARQQHKLLCYADRIAKDASSANQMKVYIERLNLVENLDYSGGWLIEK